MRRSVMLLAIISILVMLAPAALANPGDHGTGPEVTLTAAADSTAIASGDAVPADTVITFLATVPKQAPALLSCGVVITPNNGGADPIVGTAALDSDIRSLVFTWQPADAGEYKVTVSFVQGTTNANPQTWTSTAEMIIIVGDAATFRNHGQCVSAAARDPERTGSVSQDARTRCDDFRPASAQAWHNQGSLDRGGGGGGSSSPSSGGKGRK